MISFLVMHFVAGLILGARFRFAALLPAFAFVAVEAIFAAVHELFAPWYLILLGGCLALQVGYAAAAFVRNRRAEALNAPPRPFISSRD